jgi:hypothetical protein
MDCRSTFFTESFSVEVIALASGGILSVAEQKVCKESAKGSSLWKPRRELLTPTPSVRAQEAFARR